MDVFSALVFMAGAGCVGLAWLLWWRIYGPKHASYNYNLGLDTSLSIYKALQQIYVAGATAGQSLPTSSDPDEDLN